MRLSDSTVLITGRATGIGLAMAEAFLRAGSKVLVCGRREEQHPALEIMRADANRRALLAWAGVTAAEFVASVMKSLERERRSRSATA